MPEGTIAAAWLDPATKSTRRRARIERSEFKYPLLRKVEGVWRDPQTGVETVQLVEASVADHVLVGLRAGVQEEVARAELERRGFVVRAVEAESYLLVEVAAPEDLDGQAETLRALAALDEFIEYSEPDYLVCPAPRASRRRSASRCRRR
jgi:hypothetical protein